MERMNFSYFIRVLLPILLITFLAPTNSHGQVGYETPKSLFTGKDTSARDEIMPILSFDGNTMYCVRAFHPKNMGGIWGGHDIWVSDKDGSGEWSEPRNIGPPLNNKRENAVIGISKDGETIYLLNEYHKKGKMKSGISFSKLEDGKWGQPQAITIPKLVGRTYFSGLYMHYTEKILLLSTEGQVSTGKQDIYVSLKSDSSGEWSIPINLGRQVNSKEIETSPFLSLDTKTLYFSSDGRKGWGGMDIYSCDRLDDTWTNWSEPINLGGEINSQGFDAYFTMLPVNIVYYSSNKDTKLSTLFSSKMVVRVFDVLAFDEEDYFNYNFRHRIRQYSIGCYKVSESMDTLATAITSRKGYFLFEPFSPKEEHLFALDTNDFDITLINQIEVVLISKSGRKNLVEAQRVDSDTYGNRYNVYRYRYGGSSKSYYSKINWRNSVSRNGITMVEITQNGDTLKKALIDTNGYFVFRPSSARASHLYLIDTADVDIEWIDDIEVRLVDVSGTSIIVNTYKVKDNLFKYEFEYTKDPLLSLLLKEDTLKSIAQNADGYFAFFPLPYNSKYVFGLDADENFIELTNSLKATLADSGGKEEIFALSKNKDNLFGFESLPPKEAVLYVVLRDDTLMQTNPNDDGYFVFHPLPYNEAYKLLLEADVNYISIASVVRTIMMDETGAPAKYLVDKFDGNLFKFVPLPLIADILYLISDGDTIMQSLKNKEGVFVFYELPFEVDYEFALSATSMEQIDMLPVEIIDNEGRKSAVTVRNVGGDLYRYERLPSKDAVLYVISDGDTLMRSILNADGVFAFSTIPHDLNYLFALAGKDVEMIEEIPIQFIDDHGNRIVTTVVKTDEKSFLYELLPFEIDVTKLYIIEGRDTVMILTQNERGIFDFKELAYRDTYIFAMDAKDAALIDEIPIRFADSDGTQTITTITKSPDQPFVYDYLPEKQTKLYLIEDGDTLMIITPNERGIFDFQELEYLDTYIFAMDAKDAALIDEIPIRFASKGAEIITTITKAPNEPFVYDYLPEKQTKLYLIDNGDTLMIITPNERGIFDFQELEYLDTYIFAMDAKDAALIDEIPIRFANNGAEVITTITKAPGEPFVYDYLPKKQTKLYLIDDGDTLMIITPNERGIFDFQELEYLDTYIFAMDAKDAALIDEIPIRFANNGAEVITTITKTPDDPFVYDYLPEKQTRLYLIDDGDTLMIITPNERGIFDFQELVLKDTYIFAMDAKDADMLEIPIRFADEAGTEIITTITKAPDDPFVYDYLPEKQTKLYLIDDGDTLMIITPNERGIFDFQELVLKDTYIFAMDAKDADMLEIPIRFADEAGTEIITTITKAPDDPFVYDYLPEKQTRLYLIDDGDTLMIVTPDEKGIFDFQELAYLDTYVFAMDGKDAGMIENLNIKLATQSGKDTVFIASCSKSEPTVFTYAPFKSTAGITQTVDTSDTIHIFFDFNSTTIDVQGQANLSTVINILRNNNYLSANLEGHTDSKGSAKYNINLSKARTQFVILYLANKGIAVGRLSVNGFGEDQPMAPNTNPDGSDNPNGRRLNRRVSISFSVKGSGVSSTSQGNSESVRRSGASSSQSNEFIKVSEASICRSVDNLQAISAGVTFPTDIGRLWLLTKIQRQGGADSFITHVWYFENKEVARVKLTVKSTRWRTYSAKYIDPIWKGQWKVDVLSEEGTIIESVPFKIQ